MKRVIALCIIVLSVIVFIPGNTAASETYQDVSMNTHYQSLALKYMPTLIHEEGTEYWTCDVAFDNDLNVDNNRDNYDYGVGGWVYDWTYIHILKDSEGDVYIEYWFYYVYNIYWYFDDHANDWEFLMVVLNPSENPVEVRYGAHGDIFSYSWDTVEKEDGTHPVAYVASGSHAMDYNTSIYGQLWWSGNGYIAHYYYFTNHQYTFFGKEISHYEDYSYMEASGYRYWNGIIPCNDGWWPADYGDITTPWTEKPIWNDPTLDTY